MAPESTVFEGWAIVELMGHRRLAGYVREAEQFGVAMLRLDVPEHPWQDGCTCGSVDPESLSPTDHNHTCHMFRAEDDTDALMDVHATQFYGGSSIYCLTPTSEEVARRVATQAKPTPIHSWEMPRPALAPAAAAPDGLYDDQQFLDDEDRS